MEKYIVMISIGPVQSMIVSARKSRDLWSGSWLLSELAKSCAKFLKESKAELILPFVENDEFLKENSDFSVSNKLQVVIQAKNKYELEKILNQAKQAVQQRYRKEADNALSRLNEDDIRFDIWQSQIDDVVEIQWAWAKLENNDEKNYNKAGKKAGEVLNSRKNTREFSPLAINPFDSERMIPKSSLDGLRETVLKESEGDKKDVQKVTFSTRRILSLSKSEQLDVLGVIKRLGFDKDENGKKVAEQFTPISRVMADAWILEIAEKEPNILAEIIKIYAKLESKKVASKVTGNKDKDEQSIYKAFPYDAEFLYLSRLEAKILEYEKAKKGLSNEPDALKEIEEIIQCLKDLKDLLNRKELKEYGEPYRYGALLLADGDRMGELLDKAQTQEQHREITKALSEFAGSVANIMRKYRGHCIYAGGDDVLGIVPLHLAQQCANELRQSFYKHLSKAVKKIKGKLNDSEKEKLNNPTLSVGLAICHLMTPFGIVRELADVAEKYAKGNDRIEKSKRRNALGILLSVRGGSDIQLRFNWSDNIGRDGFNNMIAYYCNKAIPSRIAYDVRDIYLKTHHWKISVQSLKNIQLAEFVRMLKQARNERGKPIDKKVIRKLRGRGRKVGLEQLANELMVARWLAAKTQKDLGKE